MARPTEQEIADIRNQKKIDEAYEKSLRNTEMAPAKRKPYTGTDESGRRTTQSDSRVSEAAKAELPSYGFEGMTIGDVMDERKRVSRERKGRMEAAGYAKGGKVSSASKRADGCAQRGKTRGKMV